MPDGDVIDKLMGLLEKAQSETGSSSKVLMDRFQLELIRDQERWRGGVTTELVNIRDIQAAGFAAMSKRFDKLENDYEGDQEKTNTRIGKIQDAVRKLRESNIKTSASAGFLTTLVFLILSKVFGFI